LDINKAKAHAPNPVFRKGPHRNLKIKKEKRNQIGGEKKKNRSRTK
jgi:hypothetical protein